MSDGSFIGLGAQQQQGYAAANQPVIKLNMGLETTDGLASFVAPQGTHMFEVINPPELSYTTSQFQEIQIAIRTKIVQSNVEGAIGTPHTERILIPSEARHQMEPDKWKTMMKFLRLKLEAICGRSFREDNIDLYPNEMTGRRFIATVSHEETEEEKDGQKTGRKFTNARLNQWEAVQQGAGVGMQQAQPLLMQQQPAPQPAQTQVQTIGQSDVATVQGGNLATIGQQPPQQQAQPAQQPPAQQPPQQPSVEPNFSMGTPQPGEQPPPTNQPMGPSNEEPF